MPTAHKHQLLGRSSASSSRTGADTEAGKGKAPHSNIAYIANHVKRGGQFVANKVAKRFAKTRRRVPAMDFIITYGVPPISASFFLADLITDALVVAAFLAQENTTSQVFGYFAMSFILIPLLLTGLFITRSQIRAYIKRRVADEVDKQVRGRDDSRLFQGPQARLSATGPMDTTGAVNPDTLGRLPPELVSTAIGGGVHTQAGLPPFLHPVPPAAPPPMFDGGLRAGDPTRKLPPAMPDHRFVPQPGHMPSTLPMRVEDGLALARGQPYVAPRRPSGDAPPAPFYVPPPLPDNLDGRAAHYAPPAPNASRVPARRSGHGVAEGMHGPVDARDVGASALGARAGRPVAEGAEQDGATMMFDEAADVTVPIETNKLFVNQDIPEAMLKSIQREAKICAIISFPIMILAAIGLDLALIIVPWYPKVTSFIGLEAVMPAYYAYRTLIEVLLEALPQVLLQLLALWVQPARSSSGRRSRDRDDLPNSYNDRKVLGLNLAIILSITIAVLNLIKTFIMLKAEANSLSMGLLPYIKYLMEVGSGRLPLRSITDNSIGERLDFEMNVRSEMKPLMEAVKKNTTLKFFTVSNLPCDDLARFVEVVEGRKIAYSLEIVSVSFTEAGYVDLLILILSNRFAQSVTFRNCQQAAPAWMHREAFTLLSYHLPSGCTDDHLPLTFAEASDTSKRSLSGRLLHEWLMANEVCSVSNTSLAHPMAIRFHVPQRQSTLVAALHFLNQCTAITCLECDYALAPRTFVHMMNLALRRPEKLQQLRLEGVRCVMDAEGTELLTQLLTQASRLHNVTLARVWDVRMPAKQILGGLMRCGQLRELLLTGNRLGSSGASMLGSFLPKLPLLRKLAIDACLLDDTAAAALQSSIGVASIPSLTSLALGGNHLTAAGLASLATCFANCRKLLKLDVSCTPLSAAAVSLSADATIYDRLAVLDHAADPSPPAAADSSNGSGNGAASADPLANQAELARCGSAADRPVSRCQTMLVWDPEMVAALEPLLRVVEEVHCSGCIFQYDAVQELLAHVKANTSLRVVGLRANGNADAVPTAMAAERTVTVATVLRRLCERSASPVRTSDVQQITLTGLAPGNLAAALRDSAAMVAQVTHFTAECGLPQTRHHGATLTLRPDLRNRDVGVTPQENFAYIWAMLPNAGALTHLCLQAPVPFAPPTSSAHRDALSSLVCLRLANVQLGPSLFLNKLGATPGHPLAGLETLALTACELGNTEAALLGALLAHMPRLSELSCADNAIGRQGVECLFTHWSGHARAPAVLTVLDLSRNPIGPDGAKLLAPCMGNLLSLRVLRLAGCNLRSRGMTAIANGILAACTGGRRDVTDASALDDITPCKLTELNVEDNDIGPSGSEALADAMRTMQELDKFMYGGNQPSQEGSAALLAVLADLVSLQVLSLGDLVKGTKGASRMLPAESAAAGTLQARFNAAAAAAVTVVSNSDAGGLTWPGAQQAVRYLRSMHALREFRLVGLGCTSSYGDMDLTIYHLAQSLRMMPSLQVLDLRGIGLLGHMAEQLVEACAVVSGLELIDLRGASTTPQALEVLHMALAQLPMHVLLD